MSRIAPRVAAACAPMAIGEFAAGGRAPRGGPRWLRRRRPAPRSRPGRRSTISAVPTFSVTITGTPQAMASTGPGEAVLDRGQDEGRRTHQQGAQGGIGNAAVVDEGALEAGENAPRVSSQRADQDQFGSRKAEQAQARSSTCCALRGVIVATQTTRKMSHRPRPADADEIARDRRRASQDQPFRRIQPEGSSAARTGCRPAIGRSFRSRRHAGRAPEGWRAADRDQARHRRGRPAPRPSSGAHRRGGRACGIPGAWRRRARGRRRRRSRPRRIAVAPAAHHAALPGVADRRLGPDGPA